MCNIPTDPFQRTLAEPGSEDADSHESSPAVPEDSSTPGTLTDPCPRGSPNDGEGRLLVWRIFSASAVQMMSRAQVMACIQLRGALMGVAQRLVLAGHRRRADAGLNPWISAPSSGQGQQVSREPCRVGQANLCATLRLGF